MCLMYLMDLVSCAKTKKIQTTAYEYLQLMEDAKMDPSFCPGPAQEPDIADMHTIMASQYYDFGKGSCKGEAAGPMGQGRGRWNRS